MPRDKYELERDRMSKTSDIKFGVAAAIMRKKKADEEAADRAKTETFSDNVDQVILGERNADVVRRR